ncbi:DUF6600 domain-containing protein [Mucilaginibacter sp. E4BP6]|uniref:DUF6600 domain-containing protein n=1 Tax=Mucilaginibacter sp. E4BP6 TaxID=2723089 RepID=UPI0015CD7A60|nr:DUF6600 domain-containing protein [Mucilaginibacter sp. E4BP6]NYE64245.1 hypothetical protein [Mucilaginibacter sp. E4BP6]
MRILKRALTISMFALAFMLFVPNKSKAQDGYISDQEFYDQLAPYGTWVQDDYYGDVWIPNVDQDFRPYATNGYWAQTEYGNTWVSDYPWGWATFHYGRWHYDDYYGWEWIPGHHWAPAWVSWRHGGGYYGWAPLDAGISISISIGGGYNAPDNYWVCAPERYMNSPRIYNYYAPHTRVVNIIHNTTIVNNTYVYNNQTYATGPRPADIQRITHRPVTVYKINNAGRPGAPIVAHNAINIYRPAVNPTPNARPARVVNAQAYRQANPNAGIGRTGGIANNHANAQKLAAVAHSTRPNTKFVNVHPAPIQSKVAPEGGRPAQAGGARPAQPSNTSQPGRSQARGTQKQQQPAVNNRPAANAPNKTQHPAVVKPAQQAQRQQQQQARQVQQEGQQKQQQARQVQQQGQQRQQQAQQQQQARQVQQQAQQRQQQAQQQQQQARQQQQQARQVQQQAQQRQQQAQQQQKQARQVQQQAQQRQQQAQQQVQARQQQQQAQRQQQQAQQQQQRAQQQQQQAQQRQQQAQQQQQRAQQQQQQAEQRQQQAQRQQQQKQPQRPPQPKPQPQQQEQH